jgi:hypothetical protein
MSKKVRWYQSPSHVFGLAIFVLAAIPIALVVKQASDYRKYYGDKESILTYFMHQTEWAPGFSEVSFDKIEIGMTEKEVLELLGPPLEKKSGFDSYYNKAWAAFKYSKSIGASNYHSRQLQFVNRKISNKSRSFWFAFESGRYMDNF